MFKTTRSHLFKYHVKPSGRAASSWFQIIFIQLIFPSMLSIPDWQKEKHTGTGYICVHSSMCISWYSKRHPLHAAWWRKQANLSEAFFSDWKHFLFDHWLQEDFTGKHFMLFLFISISKAFQNLCEKHKHWSSFYHFYF